MLKNGTYAAWFRTSLADGTGIVHMADGRLWGSDAIMLYDGTYEVDGERFSAVLTARRLRGDADSKQWGGAHTAARSAAAEVRSEQAAEAAEALESLSNFMRRSGPRSPETARRGCRASAPGSRRPPTG